MIWLVGMAIASLIVAGVMVTATQSSGEAEEEAAVRRYDRFDTLAEARELLVAELGREPTVGEIYRAADRLGEARAEGDDDVVVDLRRRASAIMESEPTAQRHVG